MVLLVQRLLKRFILNIEELAEAVRHLGAEAVVCRLESMPLYEQVYQIRRADVVVGMHGSGLSNVRLMRRGTGLIEIIPYQARGHALAYAFGAKVMAKGGAYKVLDIPKEDCIMHWLYKPDLISKQAQDEFTDHRSVSVGDFYTIFINQDVLVNATLFSSSISALFQELQAGPWKHRASGSVVLP